MSMKGEINVIAILIAISTGLGAFATFTLKNTYSVITNEFQQMHEYREKTNSRLTILEAENAVRWQDTKEELKKINETMGKLWARGK